MCPACKLSAYPRVAPAVMALVRRGTEILLARSPHFPPGMYSALAGFVEPGESIEDCIHREVLEEVGVEVDNLQYVASQSWPFPHSLMIAYTAEYLRGEVRPCDEEIVEAEKEGRFRQVEDQPALGDLLHPRPDGGGERAEPQDAKVAIAEGGQGALQERVGERGRRSVGGVRRQRRGFRLERCGQAFPILTANLLKTYADSRTKSRFRCACLICAGGAAILGVRGEEKAKVNRGERTTAGTARTAATGAFRGGAMRSSGRSAR